jgi:hypothetical protein
MDIIVPVIGKGLHVIENDPINNEDGKAENKLAGSTAGKIT